MRIEEERLRCVFRLTLTEQGEALREEAKSVPAAMQGCIPLPKDDLLKLKELLSQALADMEN